MIAKVAVSAAVYGIDKLYSYSFDASQSVQPGVRVMVPFGNGNRKTEGIVVEVFQGSDQSLKQIGTVLDLQPILQPPMLKLAAFMVERYYCTFYDAVKAIIPAGLWFSDVESYQITVEVSEWQEQLQHRPNELQIMQVIWDLGGRAERTALKKQILHLSN